MSVRRFSARPPGRTPAPAPSGLNLSPRAFAPPRHPTIQRKIGFEFEAGRLRSFGPGGTDLEKKDLLLSGQGFTVEADELNGMSDVEIVTEPVEETTAGEQKLVSTMNNVVSFTRAADRIGDARGEAVDERLPLEWFRAFGTPVANRFMQYGMWQSTVQATAGIKPQHLYKVLEHLGTRPEDPEPLDQDEDGKEGSGLLEQEAERREEVDLFARDPQVRDAHQATGRALARNFRDIEAPDSVKGLVGLLTIHLVRGQQGVPAYAKTISGPLLARTDFATLFSLLPAPWKLYFKQNPNDFVHLVINAAVGASGKRFTADDPVFAGGLYNDENFTSQKSGAPNVSGLTIGAWLRGLVGDVPLATGSLSWLKRYIGEPRGKDQLTSQHFPGSPAAKGELESLGSYGSKTDLIGGSWLFGGGTQAGIFEFRETGQSLTPNAWLSYAVAMLRYVRAVNSGQQAELRYTRPRQ